jgi:hypothetical protein
MKPKINERLTQTDIPGGEGSSALPTAFIRENKIFNAIERGSI